MLTIAIFAISIFAVVNPVSAHFTLGDLTGSYRFHANDFDPHVPGVIGYVWPGGGQNAYAGGYGASANVNFGPGYHSPYPGGKPAAVIGANQFGGAPSTSWYQLEGDAYAPFGAVLTGSTGDLIFALNATRYSDAKSQAAGTGTLFTGRWYGLVLLLPPGFTVPSFSGAVSTTITNDYGNIVVAKLGPYDRYAPGWTYIQVYSDSGSTAENGNTATVPAAGGLPVLPYYDHQFIDFSAAGEWYYVRINGVTAPSIAGRYFFKVYLYGGATGVGGEEGTSAIIQAGPPNNNCPTPTNAGGPGTGLLEGTSCNQFIPTENWPVMLVKGEIDPAIITGTVRYAGYNQTLYIQPV